MKTKLLISLGLSALIIISCNNKMKKMENELNVFIANYDSVIIPLLKEINLASWQASVTGKDSDFEKAEELEKKYTKFHSDSNAFNKLKKIKESNLIRDTLLSRQLHVLYLTYLTNQVNINLLNEIIEMETNIEKKYNNFRAVVNGKQLTDNEIEMVLQTSDDSKKLQAVWEAHKKIGPLVATDIISLVNKRNQVAKELGYKNYHEMSLEINDQQPDEIENLFDELDSLTRKSFENVKAEVDSVLAAKNHITTAQLMPWHYQNRYFQEAPKIYNVDLDKYYKNQNLEELTKNYYKSINLVIDDMLSKSDLYEKPGKNQHAFCIDIDEEGDIRILSNNKPNAYWMNTMLHEFGHAVYNKYINHDLPFILRQPAHIFTTEAIAMMFGRMCSNPQWIQDMIKISNAEKNQITHDCYKRLCLEQLVFSRWTQVMYHFEKSMYANPDQDLNRLWWTLVEKYQMIKKPQGRNEPDWASKIHIATSPCYYHNYLLGELLASQLQHFLCKNIIKSDSDFMAVSFYNKPEAGEYLKKYVFGPGDKYFWNDMIEYATGEKLTPKYYAGQFIK